MNNSIYHYTSSEAFVSMIHTNKSNSKELAFWASNVYYMNDTKEMTILYDELIKVLPKIEKDLGLSDNLFSGLLLSPDDIQGKLLGDKIKHLFYGCIFREVYVISFSDQGDSLPMWSMYGKNGNGLCLVFDKDKVNSFIDDYHQVKEVYYYLDKGPAYSYIKEKYKECYNEKEITDFLTEVLFDLSGRVKNSAYSAEQEYRIIDHVVNESDLKKHNVNLDLNNSQPTERPNFISEANVRAQNGLMIPYKEIKLPIDCLSAVIIGPSINQKLQREGLRILLKGTHLTEDDIILSDIPYRSIR